MRMKLKLFRISENLTQKEMADRIGCSCNSYQSVESGRRNGSIPFMQNLQAAFNLEGNFVMELMKNEEIGTKDKRSTD